jgi:hypothetical protein
MRWRCLSKQPSRVEITANPAQNAKILAASADTMVFFFWHHLFKGAPPHRGNRELLSTLQPSSCSRRAQEACLPVRPRSDHIARLACANSVRQPANPPSRQLSLIARQIPSVCAEAPGSVDRVLRCWAAESTASRGQGHRMRRAWIDFAAGIENAYSRAAEGSSPDA